MAITLDGSNANTVGLINSKTYTTTISGTSVDFTGIPSNAKRVSVIFSSFSLSGTSSILVQIGSGSITSTGYNSAGGGCINAAAPAIGVSVAGFYVYGDLGTDNRNGIMTIVHIGSNIYVQNHTMGGSGARNIVWWGGGNVGLSGPMDRVRITTVTGTDTFDSGGVNIQYE